MRRDPGGRIGPCGSAQSGPTADYPPKIRTVSPQPSVSKNRKNVIVKVRPKVNRKFDIKVQIRRNGKRIQTRVVYRTDRQNQKVKIPVKPGRYRFRVLPRKAPKANEAVLGGTSKIVKVPKN